MYLGVAAAFFMSCREVSPVKAAGGAAHATGTGHVGMNYAGANDDERERLLNTENEREHVA